MKTKTKMKINTHTVKRKQEKKPNADFYFCMSAQCSNGSSVSTHANPLFSLYIYIYIFCKLEQ